MLFVAVVNQGSVYPALPLIALAGLSITFVFVGAQTLVQLASDSENRGRVVSLLMTVMAAASLLSTGITSVAVGVVGARTMLDLAGVAIVASGVIGLLVPAVAHTPVAPSEQPVT